MSITQIVGSKFPSLASEQLAPSKRGYGQNQYSGASSDVPGENTTSGFLPACDYVGAAERDVSARDVPGRAGRFGRGNPRSAVSKVGDLTGAGKQTRDIGTSNVQPSFGMKSRTPRNR